MKRFGERKIITRLALRIAIMMLLLASCSTIQNGLNNGVDESPSKEPDVDAQYVIANVRGYGRDDLDKQKVVLLDSKQQLDEYYEKNKDLFVFDSIWPDYRSAGFVSFDEAISRYDSNWFDSRQIVLVRTMQPSLITTFCMPEVFGHPKDQVIIRINKEGIAEALQPTHIFIELGKVFSQDDLIDVRIYEHQFLKGMESAETYADTSGKLVLRLSGAAYELTGDIVYIYSVLGDDIPLWGYISELSSEVYKLHSLGIEAFVRISKDNVALSKSQDFEDALVLTLQK